MADNGYCSEDASSNEEESINEEENILLTGLSYDQNLECPDFRIVRKERILRNKEEMNIFSKHIADEMYKDTDSPVEVPKQVQAAILLQSCIRGFLARKKYVQLLTEQFQKEESERMRRQMEQVEEGQLLIDNHLLEVEFDNYPMLKRNQKRLIVSKVILLQREWRKYIIHKRDLEAAMETNNTETSNQYSHKT